MTVAEQKSWVLREGRKEAVVGKLLGFKTNFLVHKTRTERKVKREKRAGEEKRLPYTTRTGQKR